MFTHGLQPAVYELRRREADLRPVHPGEHRMDRIERKPRRVADEPADPSGHALNVLVRERHPGQKAVHGLRHRRQSVLQPRPERLVAERLTQPVRDLADLERQQLAGLLEVSVLNHLPQQLAEDVAGEVVLLIDEEAAAGRSGRPGRRRRQPVDLVERHQAPLHRRRGRRHALTRGRRALADRRHALRHVLRPLHKQRHDERLERIRRPDDRRHEFVQRLDRRRHRRRERKAHRIAELVPQASERADLRRPRREDVSRPKPARKPLAQLLAEALRRLPYSLPQRRKLRRDAKLQPERRVFPGARKIDAADRPLEVSADALEFPLQRPPERFRLPRKRPGVQRHAQPNADDFIHASRLLPYSQTPAAAPRSRRRLSSAASSRPAASASATVCGASPA